MEKRPPLPFETLKKMLRLKGITDISYDELLWTGEWLDLRNRVKERDHHTCTNLHCKKSQYKEMSEDQFAQSIINSGFGKYFNLLEGKYEDEPGQFSLKKNLDYPSRLMFDISVKLEVHHKYYVWNKLPWEYQIDALITLCDECHEKEHIKQPVVYADGSLRQIKHLESCYRCNGKGHIKEYKHVQNGICFACGGLGGILKGTAVNLFAIS